MISPAQSKEPEDEAWYSRRGSFRYRLQHLLFRLSKGLIKSPMYYRSLAFHAKRDSEGDRERPIPDAEHVRVYGIWTTEFFTPDNVHNLSRQLERLEASQPTIPGRSLAEFLENQRANPGSSLELYLFPPGEKRLPFSSGHQCELPRFASSAQGTVTMLTPSLTALVTYFKLREGERSRIEEAVHRTYQTRVTPWGTGVTASSPSLERRAHINRIRGEWRAEATKWHRKNFRGLLSNNGEEPEMCELAVLEGVSEGSREMMDALALSFSYSKFAGPAGDASKPIRYFPYLGGDDLQSHSVMALDSAQLPHIDTSGYQAGETGAAHYVDSQFRATFCVWALLRVFRFYQRRLAKTRDGAANVIGNARASKALAKVRADFAVCVDAASIGRELLEIDSTFARYQSDIDLEPESSDWPQSSQTLVEVIQEELPRQAQGLLRNVEDLNSALQSQANLLSAHANLRLQPWIILLALLSLIVGAIAAGPVIANLASNFSTSMRP